MRGGPSFRLLLSLAVALVATIGFVSSFQAQPSGTLWLIVAPLALVAGLLPRRWKPIPEDWDNWWGGLFLLYLGASFLILRRDPIALSLDLLLFVQAHRLVVRRRHQDDMLIVLVSFTQLLLYAVLAHGVLFGPLLLGFIFASSWALMLLRLRAGAEEAIQARAQRGGRKIDPTEMEQRLGVELDGLVRWPFAALVIGTTVALTVGTLVVFFTLPRMSLGRSFSFSPRVPVAGFSDEVDLGSVGRIQQQREPVARARVLRADGRRFGGGLYLHGLALDYFDGRTWMVSDPTRFPLSRPATDADFRPEGDWDLQVEMTLLGTSSRVLFYTPQLTALMGPFRSLEAATTDGFYLTDDPPDRLHYRFWSRSPRRDPEQLAAERGVAPPEIRSRYLQLPTLSPEVEALARSRAAEYPGAFALAQEWERWFRAEFSYDLNMSSGRAESFLDHFLFESRTGHCEYFATSMVVLLRAGGVPARLVNGFYATHLIPTSQNDYLLVTQADAHSWVEVWLPESGWVIFDPTPSAGGGEAGGVFSRFRQSLELARYEWSDWILDYDMGAQLSAIGGLGERLPALRLPDLGGSGSGSDADSGGAGARWGGWGAALLVLAGLGLALRVYLRRGDDPLPPRLRALRREVRAIALRLARLPDAPPGGATLRELMLHAERLAPEQIADGVLFAERWYAIRFGGAEADDQDLLVARALRRRLRQLRLPQE